MAITFTNLPGVAQLVKLDEELRKKAGLVKNEKREAEVLSIIRENEFHYYVYATTIGRGLVVQALTADEFNLRLTWSEAAFVSKPMTFDEVKVQVDVLLTFLVEGVIPELVTSTPEYVKNFGTSL